jgi:hypothetical protein
MNLLEQLGLSPEVLIAILGAGNIVSIPSSMPEGCFILRATYTGNFPLNHGSNVKTKVPVVLDNVLVAYVIQVQSAKKSVPLAACAP